VRLTNLKPKSRVEVENPPQISQIFQLSITNYQLPIINYQLSITNYQLPIINEPIDQLTN